MTMSFGLSLLCSNKIPCINLKLSTRHVVNHLDKLNTEHLSRKSENPEVLKCCTRLVSDFF